jgi:type III pantothenate kinase
MSGRILTLDVGNTRIKWGLHGESGWLLHGAMPTRDAQALGLPWRQLDVPDTVIGSNVAGEKAARALTDYWQARGREIEWIHPANECCGVVNGYERTAELGADRWAALVGAWNRMRAACLVVSAGTAVTLDMLNPQGEFLGGQILPGKQLMLDSLVSATHALRQTNGRVRACPRNSPDALASGIANAIVSAVGTAFSGFEAMLGSRPACLITGGDADWLADQLSIDCAVVPALIMEGLLRMAERGAYS